MSKHSPTPWVADLAEIRDANDWRVADCIGVFTYERRHENARLIVHRVNNYEALEAENTRLREALEKMVGGAESALISIDFAFNGSMDAPAWSDLGADELKDHIDIAKAAIGGQDE